jgi:hypothetical protein
MFRLTTENQAEGKTIYSSTSGKNQSLSELCDPEALNNTVAPQDSWWTVDMRSDVVVDFIEISPVSDHPCPEYSLCGKLSVDFKVKLHLHDLPFIRRRFSSTANHAAHCTTADSP